MPSDKRRTRIPFLDWLRGLAVLTMLQGHTFHSFLRPESRGSAVFIFSQFFGGQAAAIFLFLTGITYGLGMNRRESLPPGRRMIEALKRARYLLLLAFLFRVQTWAFAWPHSPWSDLLHVDVLNLMGATAALLSILALAGGVDRVRLALAAGAAITALSPVISTLDASRVPGPLRDYFVPGGDYFSIFPWGAFLAFGLAAGSAIPLIEKDQWNRVLQWAALLGFGLVLGGQYFANLPFSIYSKSDFWVNSPALVACKLGVTLLLSSGAFLWMEYLNAGWSWVQQLGTTSLVVYWTHIELVYGRWFESWKGQLTTGECVVACVGVITLMLALSLAVSRAPWRKWRSLLDARRGLVPPSQAPEYAYRSLSATNYRR